MKIEAFASTLSKKACNGCVDSGMLLAGILSTGINDIAASEWVTVWVESSLPVVTNEKASKRCRDNIIEAGKAFVSKHSSHFKAMAPDCSTKLSIELSIKLLSQLPESDITNHGDSILQSLTTSKQNEDWKVTQLTLLAKINIKPSVDESKRLIQQTRDPVNCLRLLESLNNDHTAIDDDLIKRSLQHRTRATRRLGITLLGQKEGTAGSYIKQLIPLLVLLSDEQPLHLVTPVWEEFTEYINNTTVEEQQQCDWLTITVALSMSHPDDRVVRLITSTVLGNNNLSKMITQTVLHDTVFPAGVRCGVVGISLSTEVVASFLSSINKHFSIDSTPRCIPSIRSLLTSLAGALTPSCVSLVLPVLSAYSSGGLSSASYNFVDELHELSISVLRLLDCECDFNVILYFIDPLATNTKQVLQSESTWDLLMKWISEKNPRHETVVKILTAANAEQVQQVLGEKDVQQLPPSDAVKKLHLIAAAIESSRMPVGLADCVAAMPSKFLIDLIHSSSTANNNQVIEAVAQLLRFDSLSESVGREISEFASKNITLGVDLLTACNPNLITDSVRTEILNYLLTPCGPQVALQPETADKLELCHLLLQSNDATVSKQVVNWLVTVALDSYSKEAVLFHSQTVNASSKAKKKSKAPTRGIPELFHGLCLGDVDFTVAVTCWEILSKLPAKFQGSRDAYFWMFTIIAKQSDNDSLRSLYSDTSPFSSASDRLRTSSIASEQLTRSLLSNLQTLKVNDDVIVTLFENLIISSTVAKAETLSPKHPAYLVVEACRTFENGSRGAMVILKLVENLLKLRDSCDAFIGSDQHCRRVRKWWSITGLLPHLVRFDSVKGSEILSMAAKVACEELQQSQLLIPKTRVMVQNVWAICCCLLPSDPNCVPHIRQILGNYKTETRLVVSTIIVTSQLLLTDALENVTVYLNDLLKDIISWSFSMTYSCRIHAQLLLSECLNNDRCQSSSDLSLLSQAASFFKINPHINTLREAVKLGSVVSLYFKEFPLPPLSTVNIEMSTAKAIRLIKHKFNELEESEKEKCNNSTPSAGWAQKGARRCPARARGKHAGDESNDEADESDDDSETITHQRRPTPGRPTHGDTPDVDKKICVIGSFLDNTPNQAGLCRTLEALFGSEAEVTLPSIKVTQEPGFLRMSMASERWLKIVEIPPGERLAMYIASKRLEGFRIVAVEQTDSSKQATEYTFHEKTVIIVGNEQMGVPAWLLRRPELVDDFVELPLDGASRSLNAHVTAAAMIWQFKLQTHQMMIK
eukprot:TRINITY_DN15407_c0_g1_i1.p1 TRINITY_DN15407_c0_g1~~TRINITY_DN15407_c0_g1_i1.p1  ORF type:complete len:1268 (+),score=244.76 TRINITY_DN15407_c0_g1_i1:52-3855(+)